jgi:hypothetical protein
MALGENNNSNQYDTSPVPHWITQQPIPSICNDDRAA